MPEMVTRSAVRPATETQALPHVFRIGADVVILAWDLPDYVDAVIPLSAAGGVRIAPTASLRLKLGDGGMRLLWALRRPAGTTLNLTLGTAGQGTAIDLAIAAEDAVAPLDPAIITAGLEPAAQIALVQTLTNLWSSLFRLQRNRSLLAALHAILAEVAAPSGVARPAARASSDLFVVRTQPFPDAAAISAVHVVSRSGLVRLPGAVPRPTGAEGLCHLLIDKHVLETPGALLVATGPHGIVTRKLAPLAARLPGLVKWLRDKGADMPGLREYLVSELSLRSHAGLSAALEVQLGVPLQPRRLTGGFATPSAEIVQALATPAGTLATGWYRDPAGIVSGLEALTPDGGAVDLTPSLHLFPVDVDAGTDAPRLRATGFAVLAPAFAGPVLQPRFRLRLKSGGFHALVPGPRPVDAAEARAVALRSVPPQHVSEELLAQVLSPVIGSLHRQVIAEIGAPRHIAIGDAPAKPRVSVIVPLYRVLDFLRFQIAAFAADPWFRAHAELIYVLDSPEQAGDLEHLLRGLHLVHALPMTLVVMERNGGYARANNEGAAVARAPILALVNSDVIPVGPGWLETLAARLDRRRKVGIAGPKLLFEDGSIQHAGMYFARDLKGRWLNHHFHKGMPRHYPAANEDRLVPAVTGACLVILRDLFDRIGGFTEDYVIGDYEDSDLCLKAGRENARIAYVPEVELYHLERRSISHSPDYMRGIAWQYNCATHAERWGPDLAAFSRALQRRHRSTEAGAGQPEPPEAEPALPRHAWRAAS